MTNTMKEIGKGVLICVLTALVYTIVNGMTFSFLPFTKGFAEQSASQSTNLGMTAIYMLWIVWTMYHIAKNSRCKGFNLYLAVIGTVFFVLSIMTQIETILFGSAFKGLQIWDIWMMVVGEMISITLVGFLLTLILKRKAKENETQKIDIKKFVFYMVVNGLIYLVIYFVFGYFVAWQSEELRIFYSGSPVDVGFIAQMRNNIENSFMVLPIQFGRGMLFTISIIPLLRMKWKHKYDYLVSVLAVFLCTAMGLIIPNFLFPDAVRIQHFYEMISSMFLFGIITAKLTEKSIISSER